MYQCSIHSFTVCRYTFVCTVDKDTLNCTTKTCTDNCQKKFSSADLGLNLTGKTTRFMCTDTYHGNSDSCPKNCRLIPSISTTITATITKTCPTTVSNPQQKRNNHHLCTTILITDGYLVQCWSVVVSELLVHSSHLQQQLPCLLVAAL